MLFFKGRQNEKERKRVNKRMGVPYLFPPQSMCYAILGSFGMLSHRRWHHLVLAYQWGCRLQSHSMLMFQSGYLRHWYFWRWAYYEWCCCCCHQIKRFVFHLFVIYLRCSLTHFHPIHKRLHILKQLKLLIVNKMVATAYLLLFIELLAVAVIFF